MANCFSPLQPASARFSPLQPASLLKIQQKWSTFLRCEPLHSIQSVGRIALQFPAIVNQGHFTATSLHAESLQRMM
jgi:hypothetical protein